jgi:hypothetical protein
VQRVPNLNGDIGLENDNLGMTQQIKQLSSRIGDLRDVGVVGHESYS